MRRIRAFGVRTASASLVSLLLLLIPSCRATAEPLQPEELAGRYRCLGLRPPVATSAGVDCSGSLELNLSGRFALRLAFGPDGVSAETSTLLARGSWRPDPEFGIALLADEVDGSVEHPPVALPVFRSEREIVYQGPCTQAVFRRE